MSICSNIAGNVFIFPAIRKNRRTAAWQTSEGICNPRKAPLMEREYLKTVLKALMVAGGHLQWPEISVKNKGKSTKKRCNTSYGRACEAPCVSLPGAAWGLQRTTPEANKNTALPELHVTSALSNVQTTMFSHLIPQFYIPVAVSLGRKLISRGI